MMPLDPKFAWVQSSAPPAPCSLGALLATPRPRDFAPHSLRAARAPDADATHTNFGSRLACAFGP
jgi:hypothetical protein